MYIFFKHKPRKSIMLNIEIKKSIQLFFHRFILEGLSFFPGMFCQTYKTKLIYSFMDNKNISNVCGWVCDVMSKNAFSMTTLLASVSAG